RAADELAAAGGAHPAAEGARRGRDELSPHELKVALMVAHGMTNREVAAALFLSPKTIERHLSRIYRKLDVRSRTELARLLTADAAERV
ncbi:helix-turn-helix transcriptional regulator, partial [Conexibacter sp. CPCC 205706]